MTVSDYIPCKNFVTSLIKKIYIVISNIKVLQCIDWQRVLPGRLVVLLIVFAAEVEGPADGSFARLMPLELDGTPLNLLKQNEVISQVVDEYE